MIIYLKRLKSSNFVRVKAFPMYGGIGADIPDTALERSCARAISENMHARNRTRDSRRILRKLPDLTKSPSERYKLSVCIKGSCATCIQAGLDNFYGL